MKDPAAAPDESGMAADFKVELRIGSFTDLEAANRHVNATLLRNRNGVDRVVEGTYDWRTEENFAQATKFLKDMVGGPTSTDPGNPDKPRFYYFETQQEDEALREFMRRLRQR
jgi:hypothetical protein